jgi:uncharacterized membrane protein YfcA
LPSPLLFAAIGGVTGFLAGFLGAGGGFATVVLRHAMLGNVDTSVLLYAVPGGLVGSLVGARATLRASRATIRGTFLVLMLASTIYLVAREL